MLIFLWMAKLPIDILEKNMKAIPKFNFYEKVRVKTLDLAKFHLNGEIGVVLGRTETEEHPEPFLYGVSINSVGQVWSLFESELESTGEWASPEEYYDGSSVRVQVDEHGLGSIKNPDSL